MGPVKTTMPVSLAFFILTILAACHMGEKRTIKLADDTNQHQIDTSMSIIHEAEDASGYYDSLEKAYVDTTTLKGKREWIMNQFIVQNMPSIADYDTLFDLTYDGNKDYVIGYYGPSGTGIKNRVKVYYFNTECKCYILDEELSDLPNPTFYIDKRKITGFYIGNGGGGGGRLEWINNKWTTTKEFEVDNEGDTTKWIINYPLRKKTEIIVRPFQGIPPEDILESDF